MGHRSSRPGGTVPPAAGAENETNLLAALGAALDQVFTSLRPLSRQFIELVSASPDHLTSHDLASLRPAVFDLLRTHGGLVGGAGIVTAPGLLVDRSHWLEWWWTGTHGRPEALRVDPDPAAPDFFDYVTADWYATPIRTGRGRIAGPYVDYVCTNEYSVTLSIPVVVDERAAGVAAADVLVSSLERLVVPALLRIDHPCALASMDGRIIASNSPDWLPADRIGPQHVRADATRSPERAVVTSGPWILVDLPAVT
jgi:hypothetical protein